MRLLLTDPIHAGLDARAGSTLICVPSLNQWAVFLVASLLFIQVPGPSLLFTIGRALTVGRREALLSVVGNGIGLMAQIVCVAVGLGSVVAASAQLYTAIKLVGAAYVVWLGIQAIRHRADARAALEGATTARPTRLAGPRYGPASSSARPDARRRSSSSSPSCPSSSTPPPAARGYRSGCSGSRSPCSPSPRTACGARAAPGARAGLVRPQAAAPRHRRGDRWRDDDRLDASLAASK